MRSTLIALAVVCVSAGALTAADLKSPVDVSPELRAYKLARADAVVDLRQQIGRWTIAESETTVDDFLATDEKLETAMTAFLSAQSDKSPRFEGGACHVRMDVAAEAVAEAFKTMHALYYDGDAFPADALAGAAPEGRTLSGEGQAARETGEVSQPGDMISVDSGNYHLSEHLQGQAKVYWTAHVLSRGRLLACRSAREAALAALADRLGDHKLSGETTIREFVGAEYDAFATEMFLRAARERGIRYRTDAPIVEIKVELSLLDALTSVHSWMKKNGQDGKPKIRRLDGIIFRTKDSAVSAVGAGAPPAAYLRDFPPDAAAWTQMFLDSPSWAQGGSKRVVGSATVAADAEDSVAAKAFARKAAELDSRCKLADAIAALPAAAGVTLGDLAERDGSVARTLLAAQQGVLPKESSRIGADGRVETVLEIDLMPLWEMIVNQHGQVLTMAADEVQEAAEAAGAAEAAADEDDDAEAEVTAPDGTPDDEDVAADADSISVEDDTDDADDIAIEDVAADDAAAATPADEDTAADTDDSAALEDAADSAAADDITPEVDADPVAEETNDATSDDAAAPVSEADDPTGDMGETGDDGETVDYSDDVLVIEASDD